jgi:tRNA pseudouridine13 synthase
MQQLLEMPPLPLATQGLEPVLGQIKSIPEDFVVTEIPAYQPSGEGEFLYLWVEKRDLSGPFLVRELGRLLGIDSSEIGMAGYKDRKAVTRQWISLPKSAEKGLGSMELPGLKILETSRHSNKLRPGHLHGNKFEVFLRTNEGERLQERVKVILARLKEQGLWNFYGEQRFGKNRETLRTGLDLIKGSRVKVPNFLRRLAISAVQSALFNEVLRYRIQNGLHRKVIAGDVLSLLPQEKRCLTRDIQEDQQRLDAGGLAITGPIAGWKVYPEPKEEAMKLEEAIFARFSVPENVWKQQGKLAMGSRRVLVYSCPDIEFRLAEGGIWFSFELGAGAYATELLREITQSELQEEQEC